MVSGDEVCIQDGKAANVDVPPPAEVSLDLAKDNGAKIKDGTTSLKHKTQAEINTKTLKTNSNNNIVSLQSIDGKTPIESKSKKRNLQINDENSDSETQPSKTKRSKTDDLNRSKATNGISQDTTEKTSKKSPPEVEAGKPPATTMDIKMEEDPRNIVQDTQERLKETSEDRFAVFASSPSHLQATHSTTDRSTTEIIKQTPKETTAPQEDAEPNKHVKKKPNNETKSKGSSSSGKTASSKPANPDPGSADDSSTKEASKGISKETSKKTPKEKPKSQKSIPTPKLSEAKLQSILSVATSLENMASVFNDKCDYDKALLTYRKALDKKINAFGKSDKVIAESYIKIGAVLQNQGTHKKALKEYRRAHRILEETHGKEHLELANCKDKIGSVLYDTYFYNDAYTEFRMAMEIRERVLGKVHADTAKSHSNIGMVLSAKDNHTEALSHFRKALKIKEKISGLRHPETASCYDDAGGALRDMGKFNEALIEFQKAFKIRTTQLGKSNKETAVSHTNIGTVLLKLKDLNAALSEFRKALTIRESVFGKDHPETGASHEHIGTVLLAKGDDDGALTSFRKALRSMRESATQKGRLINKLYNNIGELHFKKGNYKGALESYREALKNVEAVKGKGHPDTAACYDKIGSVLQAKGDLDEALEEFEKALKIKESVPEDGDVDPFNRDDEADEDDESETGHPPRDSAGADVEGSSSDDSKTETPAGLNVLFEAAMQHDDKDKKPGSAGGAYTDIMRERQSKPMKKRYVEKPQSIDVRFERGGGGNNHPGNKRYLTLVKEQRPVYQALNTNTKEKLEISMKIVGVVNGYGGLFLKQDEEDGNKRYYILSTDEARKKVMQALREKPKEPKQSSKKRAPSLDADATGLDAVAAAATNAARRRTALRGRPARMHKPKQYVSKFTDLDVRCERGGGGNNHPGNKRYLQLVNDMKPAYLSLPDTAKKAKHDLSLAIVNKIVTSGGRFLEMEKIAGTGTKRYYQLSESEARIKVSQALRDKPKRKPD